MDADGAEPKYKMAGREEEEPIGGLDLEAGWTHQIQFQTRSINQLINPINQLNYPSSRLAVPSVFVVWSRGSLCHARAFSNSATPSRISTVSLRAGRGCPSTEQFTAKDPFFKGIQRAENVSLDEGENGHNWRGKGPTCAGQAGSAPSGDG